MNRSTSQELWAPGGPTVRLPRSIRLAKGERERLWKGLERLVNCGDESSEYQALSKSGFRDLWPVRIHSDGASLEWHPACHKLFLFYRDKLKDLWQGHERTKWLGENGAEFLMGVSGETEKVWEHVREGTDSRAELGLPFDLHEAWQDILQQFPNATPEQGAGLGMRWRYGEFVLVTRNDFQRAFYVLFRQSWRARVCRRCKTLFIARKPKQGFCGTQCSAGSRLASKRKWWRRVGAQKRANENVMITRERKRK